MRIGIITRTLVEGDAVGNDVIGQYSSLKKGGHDPVLYAEVGRVAIPVNSISNLSNNGLDMVIYHHSIGWGLGLKAFLAFEGRKAIKYHNVTPPHFFDGAPQTMALCTEGIEQLPAILNSGCEVWADSEFNAKELCSIQPVNYKVIPPYNQADMLARIKADIEPIQIYNDWNVNVLMVGRIAPNKDNIAGLEGFAEYYRRNPRCRLFIVGDDSGEYGSRLKVRVSELKLPNVMVPGKVRPEILKAFYMIADVLLMSSQHEGFCVPMVEAFSFGLPVIAPHCTAMPYTGQDAVRYAKSPAEIADGIEDVIKNKQSYVEKGKSLFKSRYQNFIVEGLFLNAVNSTTEK